MSFCPISWASVGAAVVVVAGGGFTGDAVGFEETCVGAGGPDGVGETTGSLDSAAVELSAGPAAADGPTGAAQLATITIISARASLRIPDRCRRASLRTVGRERPSIASVALHAVGHARQGRSAGHVALAAPSRPRHARAWRSAEFLGCTMTLNIDIVAAANANSFFRQVVSTGAKAQVVLM
ncbi:MAG TPA: hypothetical protein VL749_08270, partial [Patescibacteria group bacterium]|nr:hypothetical protein [Patescibacteria group bacterium]